MHLPSIRRRAVGAAAAASLSVCTALHAQALTFEIPAGDLRAALERYSQLTGKRLDYRPQDLEGRHSPGVRGDMAAPQALQMLLKGTALVAQAGEGGAWSIVPDEAGVLGSERVVITARSISHLADRNRSGTRTETDPMELAQSVSTLQRQLLEDQQARTLEEALQNVAGVMRDDSVASGYRMRGMEASVKVNGALGDSSSSRIPRPTFALESIEVVKGPDAITGGAQAGYGGAINLITKGADGTPVRDGQLSLGSRGRRSIGLDVGDSLDDGRTVHYRVVAQRERAGTQAQGFNGRSQDYLAPSIGWDRRESRTSVNLEASYSKAYEPDHALMLTDRESLDGVEPVRFGPPDAGQYLEERGLALTLSQDLAPGWTARWKSDASTLRIRSLGVLTGFDIAWPEVGYLVSEGRTRSRVLSHQAELYGEFESGPVAHRLLLGADLATTNAGIYTLQDLQSWRRNMDTGELVDTTADSGLPQTTVWPWLRERARGLTLQDQWSWERLAGIVALRRIDTVTTLQDSPDGLRFGTTMPTVGLVLRQDPETSFYVNRAEVFRSNAGFRTFQGATLPPETGTQFEAGLKMLLLDGRMAVTSALYDVRRRNVPEADLEHGDGDFYKLSPTEISKGAEIEVSGSTGAKWDLRASMSYNKVRDDQGRELAYQPWAQVAAYVRHAFNGRQAAGPWLAAQLTWSRRADLVLPNAPGVVSEGRDDLLVHLSLGYAQPKGWSAVAGVRNLFNRRMVQSPGSFLAPAREFTVTLDASF